MTFTLLNTKKNADDCLHDYIYKQKNAEIDMEGLEEGTSSSRRKKSEGIYLWLKTT